MAVLNANLAGRLGRPDLAGVPRDPYGGTSGNPQVGAVGSIAMAAGSFGGELNGRITAGVLLAATAAAVAIYLWTRNLQA